MIPQEMIDEFEDYASERCHDLEQEKSVQSGNRYRNDITEELWLFWQRGWNEARDRVIK